MFGPVELIRHFLEPVWASEHIPSYYGNSKSGPLLAETKIREEIIYFL
jgi:hypothetical protein